MEQGRAEVQMEAKERKGELHLWLLLLPRAQHMNLHVSDMSTRL